MFRANGFTLWELLATLAVAGVLLGTGVPALSGFLLDSRLTADVNAWILAIQFARSESYKRGRPVVVCRTTDASRCEDTATAGWMVFVNLDGAFPPHRSATEPLLYVHRPELTGSIVGNQPFYEFRPGRRSTNATTVFCERRGAATARAVIVSYTGRPRVATRDADGRPLRCAGLT